MRINSFLAFLLTLILFMGCSKDESKEIPEEPDTIAPEVMFEIAGLPDDNNSGGGDGATDTTSVIVPNIIVIEISAEDARGVEKVEAFVDTEKAGEDLSAPFSITIDFSKIQAKGIVLSKSETQYTLKVTATDFSGNQSSVEQQIIVDGEMPVISEVSMQPNGYLKGEDNPVTFKVTDNEALNIVSAKIDDMGVDVVADSTGYHININTLDIADGPHELTIAAIDMAANTAQYQVLFTSDNTGPEISYTGVNDLATYDLPFNASFTATDAYSEINSLVVKINDSIILEGSVVNNLSTTIDPDNFNTGDHILKIESKDVLGNTSSDSLQIRFLRRLATINLEQGALDPSVSRAIIFANAMDGTLLDKKEIHIATDQLIINTAVNVAPDQEFMLTFANLYDGYLMSSYLSTIQNLTKTNPGIINIGYRDEATSFQNESYPFQNVYGNISFLAEGPEYKGNYLPDNPDQFFFERHLIPQEQRSSKVYIASLNNDNNNYSYIFLDAPIDPNTVIDYNQFVVTGVETRYYNAPFAQPDQGKSATLRLTGYLNEQEYQNNAGHLLWASGRGIQSSFSYADGIRYSFNTNFSHYRYELTLEDYFTRRTGEPLAYYAYPDWNIDHTFSNNKIHLTKGGNGYVIGNAYLENNNQSTDAYRWKFVFDAQNTSEVVIPELPEEMASWNIYTHMTNSTIETRQVSLKTYEGINDYSTYLSTAIKSSLKSKEVSERMDVVFNNIFNTYNQIDDFFLYH